jgi:hypothetical protein
MNDINSNMLWLFEQLANDPDDFGKYIQLGAFYEQKGLPWKVWLCYQHAQSKYDETHVDDDRIFEIDRLVAEAWGRMKSDVAAELYWEGMRKIRNCEPPEQVLAFVEKARRKHRNRPFMIRLYAQALGNLENDPCFSDAVLNKNAKIAIREYEKYCDVDPLDPSSFMLLAMNYLVMSMDSEYEAIKARAVYLIELDKEVQIGDDDPWKMQEFMEVADEEYRQILPE